LEVDDDVSGAQSLPIQSSVQQAGPAVPPPTNNQRQAQNVAQNDSAQQLPSSTMPTNQQHSTNPQDSETILTALNAIMGRLNLLDNHAQ
jgi:hypothetical protein